MTVAHALIGVWAIILIGIIVQLYRYFSTKNKTHLVDMCIWLGSGFVITIVLILTEKFGA